MASTVFQKRILAGLLSLTAAFGVMAQETSQAQSAVETDTQPAGKVIEAHTEAEFKAQVLASSKPVIAVFSAEKWCGVCRMVAPALDRFAKERPDVTVVKVDFDRLRNLSASYGARSVPHILAFADGKPGRKFVGGYPGLSDNMSMLKGLVPAVSAATGPTSKP